MSTATHPFPARSPLVLADLVPGERTRDVLLVLVGALLMALLAQVSIPVPGSPVPITGQTLGVVVAGATLGANRGGLAMLLYVALGLFLPVYADGESGLAVVTGANGGYLIGFVVAGYAIGRLAESGTDRKYLLALATFVVGQLIVFGIGVPWLKVSANLDWATAIDQGFTPFILGGLVKAALAGAAMPTAWRLVNRPSS